MGCFRFLAENFLDEAAAKVVSSQASGYPVANVYDNYRRSRTWRTGGYWKIESGSNTITFRDTIGVDKVATVAAAEYASTASLLAAIDAAFEAAGAANYTVTTDTTTGKIKITSDLSGGATLFTLRWTASTAMAAILGYDSSADDTGASTYTADSLRIHTEEFLEWDLGAEGNPGIFVAIFQRNSPIPLSPGATIKLQGNSAPIWNTPEYSATLSYDDHVIYEAADDNALHSSALRYWRFQIIDKENPNLYVAFNQVYLGPYYQPERGAPQFPFGNEMVDYSDVISIEGGQSLPLTRQKAQAFSVEMFALTQAECEEVIYIWEKFGRARPFFVQVDGGTVVGSTPSKFLKWVRWIDAPTFKLISPGVYEVSLKLREEL